MGASQGGVWWGGFTCGYVWGMCIIANLMMQLLTISPNLRTVAYGWGWCRSAVVGEGVVVFECAVGWLGTAGGLTYGWICEWIAYGITEWI